MKKLNIRKEGTFLKKKENKLIYFAILHILLLVYSCGGIFSKLASFEPFLSLRFCLLYGGLIIVLGIYAVFWQQIIKKLPLTIAYANKAVGIIWSLMWGVVFFDEMISWRKILGALIVIVGIVLYSLENKYEQQ